MNEKLSLANLQISNKLGPYSQLTVKLVLSIRQITEAPNL
jgi:hypothetical protein